MEDINATMHQLAATILETAKTEIQSRMASEGINASGRSAASFRVVDYIGGVRLEYGGNDTAPLPTLEVGRSGGKVPVGFSQIIEQWTRDKGLTFPSEGDRRSFSYLTARKIAREGTRRNKQHVDVYSTIITEAAKQAGRDLAVYVTAQIHNILNQ